jgi:hypothetical protein
MPKTSKVLKVLHIGTILTQHTGEARKQGKEKRA